MNDNTIYYLTNALDEWIPSSGTVFGDEEDALYYATTYFSGYTNLYFYGQWHLDTGTYSGFNRYYGGMACCLDTGTDAWGSVGFVYKVVNLPEKIYYSESVPEWAITKDAIILNGDKEDISDDM
jgi:hypothetical protein